MNDVVALLLQHRSIRRFREQSLQPGQLEQLIRAGQAAATSSYIQATSVIQVANRDKRNALVELTNNQPYVGTAAEFLVFCADLARNRERTRVLMPDAEFGWMEQLIAATVDVALFAQNVVVAAESQGLGCCYIGGIRNNPEQVCTLLNLPHLVYPVFGLCIGHPAQDPQPKPRLPLETVLHLDAYDTDANNASMLEDYDSHVREYYQVRSKGKLNFSWSEQMARQVAEQSRPFMKKFLENRGLATK